MVYIRWGVSFKAHAEVNVTTMWWGLGLLSAPSCKASYGGWRYLPSCRMEPGLRGPPYSEVADVRILVGCHMNLSWAALLLAHFSPRGYRPGPPLSRLRHYRDLLMYSLDLTHAPSAWPAKTRLPCRIPKKRATRQTRKTEVPSAPSGFAVLVVRRRFLLTTIAPACGIVA